MCARPLGCLSLNCASGVLAVRYREAFALKALLAIIGIFIYAVAFSASAMAGPEPRVALAGHIPPQIFQSQFMQPTSASQTIPLTLVLKWRNQQNLDSYLQHIYTPGDPLYGQSLTPAQFTAQYGPTQSDYDAVIAFARSQGLAVTATTPNRLIVDVTGTAAQVGSAFGVQLSDYRDSSGRIFYAPNSEPTVPSNLSGILTAIYGISNAALARPVSQRALPSSSTGSPASVGNGPVGGLTPSEIRSVYSLSSLYASPLSLSGAGQTLAVYELADYNSSDVTFYDNYFGLPTTPLQNIVYGQGPASTDGGADEVTLDIELQEALAPGATKILVYQAKNGVDNINLYNKIATDDLAQSISTSWGLYEQGFGQAGASAEYSIFQEMATQRQSIYAAAGDTGAYADASAGLDSLSVWDPASQPFITACGGTMLDPLTNFTTWDGETSWAVPTDTWYSPVGSGGGGGISSFWPIPSWQVGAVTSASLGSTTNRNVPDISLEGDWYTGYSIYFQGGWGLYGGTSCVSPLYAAFTALVNQQRAAIGLSTLGFANPAIYQIGEGSRYSLDFHDIADGSNNLYYPAVTGYDLSTGWGTMIGSNLFTDLTLPMPTTLTAEPGNAQVFLSWQAVAGATSYNIYRSTTSGGEGSTPVKTGVTGTTYTDTGLTNGTTYYYEVTAVIPSGEGFKSNEASASPSATSSSAIFVKQDTTTSGSWKGVYGSDGFNIFTDTSSNNPTIPSYATVNPTGNTVYQWAAPSTSNPTYCLQQASAGSTNRLAGVWYSSSSFSIDLNLTDGNTHQIALYLLAWLNTSLVETVTITDANSGTTLDTRSVSGFSNGFYNVYDITGHVKITITLSSGKNCVLSALFFDPKPAPPAAPVGLTATAGNTQVSLSWPASTGAMSYNVYRSTTSGGEGSTPYQTGVTTTSFTDTGLTNGTTYYYEVTAVNSNGESGKSNEASATPQVQKPAAPTNLTATAGNNQVALAWTASSGATSYNVYRGTSSGGETLYQSGVSGTTYTDTGVTNGTTYYYEVTAVNSAGESGKSNEASATPNPPPPSAPTNLVAIPGNNEVVLSWTPPNPNPGVSYYVYRGTTAGGESSTPLVIGATDPYEDTTAVNGTTYYYKVAAFDSFGTSPMSNEASATPAVRAFASGDFVASVGRIVAGSGSNTDTVYEFTPSNSLVQSVTIPAPSGASEPLLDSVVDLSGNLDSEYGTPTTYLSTYNAKSGVFTSQTYTNWTAGVIDGQTATYQNYVYAAAQEVLGNLNTQGIVRFNMANNTSTLFAPSLHALNVSMGLDGYLYVVYQFPNSPGDNQIAVFNPVTMTQIRNIVPNYTSVPSSGGGVNTVCVDETGSLYILDLDGNIFHCDSNGNEISYIQTDTFDIGTNAFTIDINTSGQIIVGEASNDVVETTTSFATPTTLTINVPNSQAFYQVDASFIRNAPAPPTNLAAVPGNGQVSLSWSAVSGADGYVIKRSTTTGGPYAQVGFVAPGTTFTDTTVTNGATYYYVVNADSNANGYSADSSQASATPSTNPPPPAPTNLIATGGNAQVALSWTASTGATSYNIYRATTSGGEGSTPYQTGVTSTTYTDTGVTNGTTYYYEVTAVNSGGESGKSNEASATPNPAATAVFVKQDTTTSGSWKGVYGSDGFNIFTDTSSNNPTIPSYATVNPTGNTVYQWAAPSTSNPTYCLQQASAGSTNRLAGVWYSSSSFSIDLNLTDGKAHQIALYLLAWLSTSLVETVTITDANSGATLDSRSVSSFNNGFYNVYDITGHVKITITLSSGKNCVLSALFFDPKPAPPAAPTGLTATAGNTQVALSWTGSTGATSYNIYRSTTSGGEGSTPYQTGVTTTSFTDTGLTNGTTYYYEVTAVNSNGESGKSNEASATPQVQKPAAPTNLTATAGNNQVALAWTASSGATSYNVYRGTSSGGEALYQSGITGTSYTDTGVTNGTTYYYEVTAVNSAGESGKSNEASATPQLLAPTNLTATPGNAQVALAWTASPGATAYDIYRSTTSGGETLYQSNITTATYTDTSVTNGTTYYYEVTAVASGAQSAKSNEASATPTAVTAAAVFIKQDTTTSGSWKGVYGSDGFNVFTDTSSNNPTIPSYATVTPTGNTVYQWAAPSTSNPTYCLQQAAAGSTNRLAGVWYSSTSFSIDLNLTDGNTHQVALYLLAWLSTSLVETVTITDAVSGATLDTRTVSSFNNGFYNVYDITGHVKITIALSSGKNCVLSALFFDPKPPAPAAPTGLTATAGNAQVSLSWTGSTGATSYNIYRGTTSGGEGTTPVKTGVTTTSYTDTGLTNGTTYYYEVTAVSANGEGAKSNEASATPSSSFATVSFVKQDTTTSGSWKGVYGADGFNVFTDTSSNNPTIPSYATVTPTGNTVYQWAAPSTSNPTYCLQQAAAGSTNRLAGVWYSPTSFSIDLNLTDGNTHQVALYLLAWLSTSLVEMVTITDANSGATLNTQTVSSFSNGDYEVYNISGHVKITIALSSGKNCVMSGLFFR